MQILESCDDGKRWEEENPVVIEEGRRIYHVFSVGQWKLTREVSENPSFQKPETDDKGYIQLFSLIFSSYWKRIYVVSLLRSLDFSGKHGNRMQRPIFLIVLSITCLESLSRLGQISRSHFRSTD